MDRMPKFTVSIEMDFEVDDEEHAAARGYKALLNNPPPLWYMVTGTDGRSRNIVVKRDAVQSFGVNNDFIEVADSLLSAFKPRL